MRRLLRRAVRRVVHAALALLDALQHADDTAYERDLRDGVVFHAQNALGRPLCNPGLLRVAEPDTCTAWATVSDARYATCPRCVYLAALPTE